MSGDVLVGRYFPQCRAAMLGPKESDQHGPNFSWHCPSAAVLLGRGMINDERGELWHRGVPMEQHPSTGLILQ